MPERILTHILEIQADKRIVSIRAATGDSFKTLSLPLRMYSKKNPHHVRLQQPTLLPTTQRDNKTTNRKETLDSLEPSAMLDGII